MRPIVCSGFALLLAVAACGGAKKDADSPANAEDTASSGDGGEATAEPSALSASTTGGTPCGGTSASA